MKGTAIRSLFMENNPVHTGKKTGQSHLKISPGGVKC